jgi:CRISPR/Cas system-associated protein Cas10 (large subunit of type III CRISPR-Cas system)
MSARKIIENKNFTWREEHFQFVEMQHHCALCASELEIRVETCAREGVAREEAFCPTCKLKTRQKDHSMQ